MRKILCILIICILTFSLAQAGFAAPSVSAETSRGETVFGIETYTEYPSPEPDDPRVSLVIRVCEAETQKCLPNIIVNIYLVGAQGGQSKSRAAGSPGARDRNAYVPPVTGSDGSYMTDEKGEITIRMFPSDDNLYVIEINEPEYEEYLSPEFHLRDNMKFDINLVAKAQPSPSPTPLPSPDPSPAVPSPALSAQNPGAGPKTGDETNMGPSIFMAAISGAAIAILLFYRNRKKKNGGGK